MKPVRMLLALGLALWVCSPAFGDEPEFKRGEVIVEVNPGVSIASINARYGTTLKERLYDTNTYLLRTPNGKKENKWRRKLKKDPDVTSAELNPLITSPSLFGRSTFEFPDGFAQPGFTSQDFLSQQGLFDLLQLDEVLQRSRGGRRIVAVIDTGVDRTHPDLTGRLWRDTRSDGDSTEDSTDNDGDGLVDDYRGWDFVDKDNDPTESWGDPQKTIAGHGTFIARIIALLAPECRIMPIRAFGPDGVADAFIIATAIKYATDHGADVINLSLGSPDASPLLEAAIADARNHGVFLVAAVGNDNDEKVQQYPASDDSVLAVAAIDLTSHKCPFSNFGNHVDVCAPGSNLISAFPGQPPGLAAFAEWSGTSFAAPFAAAEAALILSVDPANDVKATIEDTALNIDNLNPGFAHKLGKGRISPLDALVKVNAPVSGKAVDHSDAIELTRAPGISQGRGVATIKIMGETEAFVVEASGLPVDGRQYGVAVNGGPVIASQIRTPDRLGTVRFVFATGSSSPPPIHPVTNIGKVEVRNSSGAVVLGGQFKLERAFKQARLISPFDGSVGGGIATVKIEGVHQELAIQIEGLSRGATYFLKVDAIAFPQPFSASASGFAGALFTNDGAGIALPAALLPVANIRVVEVYDINRMLVRRGQFADAATVTAAPR